MPRCERRGPGALAVERREPRVREAQQQAPPSYPVPSGGPWGELRPQAGRTVNAHECVRYQSAGVLRRSQRPLLPDPIANERTLDDCDRRGRSESMAVLRFFRQPESLVEAAGFTHKASMYHEG